MRRFIFTAGFIFFLSNLSFANTFETVDLDTSDQSGDYSCDIELCGTTLFTDGYIHLDADNGNRYWLRGRGTLTIGARYCFAIEFRRDQYGRKYAHVCSIIRNR